MLNSPDDFEKDDDDMGSDSVIGKKVTRQEASKILGVSKATLRRYEERGIVKPCEVTATGVRYFYVRDLNALKDLGMTDEAPDDSTAKVSMQVMGELIKESLVHVRRSAEMYFGPTERIINALLLTNERQEKALSGMQEKHLEFFTQLESLLSQKHERDLAAEEQRAKLQTRQEMIQRGLGLLPHLAAKFVGDGLGEKVTNFLRVLDPAKLAALANPEMGLFSDEERKALQELLDAAGVKVSE
ncbi:MAG TPA: MerR family DNA-binding transcriptional regulator [Terriglobales bacterium]|jgi:hypothetical protein|nr:MerR family DNA-binding transcriptional regulator [Terriglobales bacterium]